MGLGRVQLPLVYLEHRVAVVRYGRHRLQHIPVLYNLAVGIKAKDIDACGFPTGEVQIARMHKRQIAVDRDTLDLAWKTTRLLDEGDDPVDAVRQLWVVLDEWPGHEAGQRLGFALIEGFVVHDRN